MRGFLSVVLLFTVMVVIMLAVIIGISLGIGWVLTLFLPFSLFEGTLLGMIAALTSGVLWYHFLRSVPPFELEEGFEVEEEGIPEERFWKREAERTWERWFEYMLANAVHEELVEYSSRVERMGEGKLEEVSIRLAEAAVEALKKRSPRAKRLRVSWGVLKQEVARMGKASYDEGLLDAAAAAMNVELVYLEEELREVMRGRLWEEQAEVF